MAIQTSGLSQIALRVTDLARAQQVYTDVPDFQTVLKAEGLVLVNGARHTHRSAWRRCPDAARRPFQSVPGRAGPSGLAVSDAAALEGLRSRLDAAGVRNIGIAKDDLTGGAYISFYDPAGIAWELYAMPSTQTESRCSLLTTPPAQL